MLGGKIKNIFSYSLSWHFLKVAVFCVLSFFIAPLPARAGTIIFSPSSGNYQVGKTFTVGVYVSSADEAMNAAQAVVNFPKDKLEAVSISKSGSIMSLWIQEPSFSNNLGTINFEGVVLNPGFTGRSGKILSITFKAKSSGQAVLSFSNGSLLANDGQGTDILTGLGAANFNLTLAEITPEEQAAEEQKALEAEAKTGVSAVPIINSPNVPDQNKWYSISDPRFEWPIPRGITGVSFFSDHNVRSNPGAVSDGLMSFYQYKEAPEDGVWYFHLRLRNNVGWGAAAHYRYQIDRTPPTDLAVSFPNGKESDNPAPHLTVSATDVLSGVDFYKISIDNGEPIKVTGNEYTVPPQGVGKHTVLVQVADKAGNESSVTEEFSIKTLNPPQFTEYSEEMPKGELLVLKGKTYPQSQVTIWLQHDNNGIENQVVNSGVWGDFTFVYRDKTKAGVYKVWADVIDGRGLRSGTSRTLTIAVQQSAFWKFTSRLFTYLEILIPILGLLLLLIILMLYLWKKLAMLKKALRKEVREVENVVCRAFTDLRNNIEDQLAVLEKTKKKRQLTKEEAVIAVGLAKSLVDTKQAVKRIRHLEDETK